MIVEAIKRLPSPGCLVFSRDPHLWFMFTIFWERVDRLGLSRVLENCLKSIRFAVLARAILSTLMYEPAFFVLFWSRA